MSWDYKLTPEAVRKLRDLGPSAAKEIKAYLETRIKGAADPRTHGKALRHGLKGFWRYRVRDWRILCRLEDGVCIVIVVDAGHRSSVYD
ncbi:MAG: addiction module toxin RelE [Rariglobus sp.]|nr:addiction module toxin RelE [Rariglobus sp.]